MVQSDDVSLVKISHCVYANSLFKLASAVWPLPCVLSYYEGTSMTNNVMLGSPYTGTFTRWGLEKHSAKINANPCVVLGLSTALLYHKKH